MGVTGLPSRGVAAFHRSFRRKPYDANRMFQAMQGALSLYPGGNCKFDKIDISRCRCSGPQLRSMLDSLRVKHCTVSRFKAFRCGLCDKDVRALARWLEQMPPDATPSEIH